MSEKNYDEEYFRSHCGLPYNRDELHWTRFFGEVAGRIDTLLAPKTVFDAGCAIGFLVECLRARGIEAYGRDFSTYAISQVPPALQPFCECGSIADPIEGNFDLVTCIEVVEHMPEDEARRAIANMCQAASLVLFSSSPLDFTEVTHINVQPPIYWMQLFAEHGFAPRADFDGSFLCPWAILFERRAVKPALSELEVHSRLIMTRIHATEHRAAKEGERGELLNRLQNENAELHRLLSEQGAEAQSIKAAISEQSKINEEWRSKSEADLARLGQRFQDETAKLHSILSEQDKTSRNIRDVLSDKSGMEAEWRERFEGGLAQFDRRLSQLSSFENEIPLLTLRLADIERRRKAWRFWRRFRIGKKKRPSNAAIPLTADESLVEASGLFNAEWYQAQYPDVPRDANAALRHYFEYGAGEGRDPNPHFSTSWYRSSYPDVALSGMNPLLHYVKIGSQTGRRPSEAFDPLWYRDCYPDISANPVDPYHHYVRHGHAEGRRCNVTDKSRDVTLGRIEVMKEAKPARELVLFVTHAPHGQIKPHVPVYLAALQASGLSVVAIVVAEPTDKVDTAALIDHVDGLFIRENGGYDFAAWAHVARLIDLSDVELLCLANDSMLGPFTKPAMQQLMERVRACDAGLIGFTESFEYRRHFQSYFLAAKNEAVRTLVEFLGEVRWLESKQEVIWSYELQTLAFFEKAGLNGEALFPSTTSANRTLAEWRELISEGFPFIKMAVVQSHDLSELAPVLEAQGFDVAIAEGSLDVIRARSIGDGRFAKVDQVDQLLQENAALAGQVQSVSNRQQESLARIAQLENELTRARKKPWKLVKQKVKYRIYKWLSRSKLPLSTARKEKFAWRALRLDPYRANSAPVEASSQALPFASRRGRVHAGEQKYDPAKPNVLVVSHEASRTGAPVLVFNVAKELSSRYNVTILTLLGGPLISDFRTVACQVVNANFLGFDPDSYEDVIGQITRENDFEFSIVNSIQSRGVLSGLRRHKVPSILLIHEFSAYVGEKTAFVRAMSEASETVFSTRLTLESALDYARDLTPRQHVLSQGRCRVPPGDVSKEAREAANRELLRVFAPARNEARPFTVLGIGTVEMRKGVDLFLQIAARVAASDAGGEVRFIWIGKGYDPADDTGYSVFLQDYIRRTGLGDRVTILPPTSEIESAYELSDVLLISSRLDPLPNVAIDALSLGLPVLCFERATGVADTLAAEGLGEDCVANYLDVDDMAAKLLRLVRSKEHYERVARSSKSFALTAYDLGNYVGQIETLAGKARARLKNEKTDIEEIIDSGSFRDDFFQPPFSPAVSSKQLVKDYLARLAWGPRKPEPGFNPFIYASSPLSGFDGRSEAYADFLRKGRPEGDWLLPVLQGSPAAALSAAPAPLKSALHIHAYFVDQLKEIIERLAMNDARPDLFVSTGSASTLQAARDILADYKGRVVAVEEVPNIGRDIGPLLTQFGPRLAEGYDVIGHVHVKKSPHIGNSDVVKVWSDFIFENIIGGSSGGRMLDLILDRMAADERIGIVYPDDPHVVGWTRNLSGAERLARVMDHSTLPPAINFPVGTMFWMRSAVFRRFVDLDLGWSDYPKEPLGEDGTDLHALERLFGVIPLLDGWKTLVTNIRGITR